MLRHDSRILAQYARRFRQSFPGLRGGTGLQRRPSRLEETSTGLVNKLEVEPLTTTVSDAATGENIGCCSCPGLGRGRNSTGVTVTIMLYVGAADHLSRGSENSQAPLLAAEALFILPQGVWWHTGPLTNSDVPD